MGARGLGGLTWSFERVCRVAEALSCGSRGGAVVRVEGGCPGVLPWGDAFSSGRGASFARFCLRQTRPSIPRGRHSRTFGPCAEGAAGWVNGHPRKLDAGMGPCATGASRIRTRPREAKPAPPRAPAPGGEWCGASAPAAETAARPVQGFVGRPDRLRERNRGT